MQNNWLWKRSVGIVAVGETPSLTEEYVGETHRVLNCVQTHLPANQHLNGTNRLWEVRNVTESGTRAQQAALSHPPHTAPRCSKEGFPTLVNT